MNLEQQLSEQMPEKTVENSFQAENNLPYFPVYPASIPALAAKADSSSPRRKSGFYSEGNGVKLKYIETVVSNIKTAPDAFIEIMHSLLFLHLDEKPNMRQNILEFSGLKCDIGTVNYMFRLKILSVLTIDQLKLICNALCIPVWQYSRLFLINSIMDFLTVPVAPSVKGEVHPLLAEAFAVSFDYTKIAQIISQELKPAETEEIEVVPDIHISEESSPVSKEATLPLDSAKTSKEKITELKPDEKQKMETVPDLKMPNETPTVTPQVQYVNHEGHTHQIFPKVIDIPNVFEAYPNYDVNYQRELLKSSMSLTLNSNGYSGQSITDEEADFRLACAKYMRNYHANQHQQSKRTSTSSYQETEEQAALRRAQNAVRMRNYRQSLRARETEEQAAARRAQNALRMRNYRKFKQEIEPEMAAERRAQNAERMRNYRKIKRELEPEQDAERRAQNALRMRNYRKNRRQNEPE